MPRKQLRPPIKLRKSYAPLIEKCRNIVLTSAPQTTGTAAGDSLLPIVIAWGVKEGKSGRLLPDYPEGFPQGSVISREAERIVVRHDVRAVLRWLKEQHYVTYDSADLFAMRLPVLMMLAKNELKLDRMLDCVDFEQQEFTKDIDSDE
jgi:hypothetical protein